MGSTDRNQLVQHTQSWITDFPDLHSLAYLVAHDLLRQLTGESLDPEQIWWHRFDSASTNAHSFSGWEHSGTPRESLTFLALLCKRFSAHDQENLDSLQVMGGFYREGPQARRFDQHNEVRLLPEAAARAFWKIDFASLYGASVERFWSNHGHDFLLLARAHFLVEVHKAYAYRWLEASDLQLLRSALFSTLQAPLNLTQLGTSTTAAAGVGVWTFDIAGFLAEDSLRVVSLEGRQVLYLPGDTPSLRAFADDLALYQWLRQTLASRDGRRQLSRHFNALRKLEGEALARFEQMLDAIRDDDKGHAAVLLNQEERQIDGDGFQYLRERAEAQMLEQVQTLTSNARLREQAWISYLGAFLNLAATPAMVCWPLALLVVGAGLASTLLNTREAMHARNSAARRQAIGNAISSATATVFSLPFVFSLRLPDIELPLETDPKPSTEIELQPLTPLTPLGEIPVGPAPGLALNSLGMIEQQDLQWLYGVEESLREDQASIEFEWHPRETRRFDLATRMAEEKVVRTFGSLKGALAFAEDSYDGPFVVYQIDAHGMRAVSIRHNLQHNWHFTVQRQGLPSSFMQDCLEASVALEDFADGAWLVDEVHLLLDDLEPSRTRPVSLAALEALDNIDPQFFVDGASNTLLHGVMVHEPTLTQSLPRYRIQVRSYLHEVRFDLFHDCWRNSLGEAFGRSPDGAGFVRLKTPVPLPPADVPRMERALRELGIPARFPLRIEPLPLAGEVPIPRKIHSIWIGKKMPLRHAQQVLRNASEAAKGHAPLEMHLYLSINDVADLARTLELLKPTPPSLQIHMLEQTEFFQAFRQSPFYVQYRAASSGPAVNYSSAVDTLRYQLLRSEGGLYMDVDDQVLPAAPGRPPLGDQPLKVKQGRLLLNGLYSQSRLGMIGEFNTSNFGSLADNPLLDRISEESLLRYLADRELFRKRPYQHSSPDLELTQYARRINYVSGPGVFNAVIDRELPAFRQFRMICRLGWEELCFEPGQIIALNRQYLANLPRYSVLQELIGIGSTGSWMHTR